MENQDRSVSVGGNLIGGAIVTGDNNITNVTFEKVELPPPEAIDISAELNELKKILKEINLPDKDIQKVNNAIEEAKVETKEAQPNRDEVGQAINRALNYAKKADGFADTIIKLKPHVLNVAGWLGENWSKILAVVGLSV